MEMETRSEMLAVAPAGAAEESLISQSTWGSRAGLWERGMAKKAIARELGLNIKTVRKWCCQSCRRGGRSGAVCWMGGRDSCAPGLRRSASMPLFYTARSRPWVTRAAMRR